VEDAELVAGVWPKLGRHGRVQRRAVGDDDLRREPVGLEVLEEPPHVIGVVLGDHGEGDRSSRTGAVASSKVERPRCSSSTQGPLAVVGHAERLGPLTEAVVDEPVGRLQEEVPPE
jgi:hypothetical protein